MGRQSDDQYDCNHGVLVNRTSRFHLAREALRRTLRRPPGWQVLTDFCTSQLSRHHHYIREHLEDMPEVRDWAWPG